MNTVNEVRVMSKGIALMFREASPGSARARRCQGPPDPGDGQRHADGPERRPLALSWIAAAGNPLPVWETQRQASGNRVATLTCLNGRYHYRKAVFERTQASLTCQNATK